MAETFDICVYGGTASGVVSAIAAARTGRSVIVIEPSRWLGGMIGGGIRITTDCEYLNHVGGQTRDLLLYEHTFHVAESAGIAADLALDGDRAVQEVEIDRLQRALRDAGQILEWDGEGYGPYWFNKRFDAWWEKHPEGYTVSPPNPR